MRVTAILIVAAGFVLGGSRRGATMARASRTRGRRSRRPTPQGRSGPITSSSRCGSRRCSSAPTGTRTWFLDAEELKQLAFPDDFTDDDKDRDGRVSMREFLRVRFHDYDVADTTTMACCRSTRWSPRSKGGSADENHGGRRARRATLLSQGCPSAYQRTYEKETQRLEAEQRAADARAAAEHAQASRYAAVVYFDVGSTVNRGRRAA